MRGWGYIYFEGLEKNWMEGISDGAFRVDGIYGMG